MSVTANPPSRNRHADIDPRIEALGPDVHRMARRFLSSEKEAAALARKTIARAKRELPVAAGEDAVRLCLFRSMHDIFAADLRSNGRPGRS